MALTRATDKIIANADGNLNLSGIVTASRFSGPLVPSGDVNVGSNIKLGAASGIVTATSFSGDGSNLTSLPAGLGTALSSTQTSPLNKLYYTNEILSIGATVTVDHPATGTGAYTQYADLRLEEGADLIISDGDDVIPDILGLGTDGGGLGAGGTGRIRVDSITNKNANGAPNFPNGLTGTAGTFTGAISAASGTITGNLGVGGVLTYEDVTNIDSVGVITARSGIDAASNLLLKTGGTEKLKIDSSGRVHIGGVTGPNSAKLFVSGTNSNSYVTLRNTSASDGSGARWNSIRFQGTQSGGEVSDLVHLQANHDGTSDDEKGSFQILVNDGNDGDSLQERIRITSGGQVLVNTTTATHADNRIESHSAGGYNIVAKSTNGNGGFQNFTGLASNGTITSYITHNGRGYFEDGVQFAANGEVLDSYEEGTWTPSFDTSAASGAIGSITYSLQAGHYTKVGDLVYVEGVLRGNVTNNSTGTWDIAGLPFTYNNNNGTAAILHCKDQASWVRAPHLFSVLGSTTRARARGGIDVGNATYTNGQSDMFAAGNNNNNRVYFAGCYKAA